MLPILCRDFLRSFYLKKKGEIKQELIDIVLGRLLLNKVTLEGTNLFNEALIVKYYLFKLNLK